MVYRIDVTREEKERELQVLLNSGIVREKTQLHSLLAYLGAKALEDPAELVKEYTIGVDALGKSSDYDPRIDPTVRVEVARLRKRLDEYYSHAGSGHLARMTIPKGGYLPVFVEATSTAATPARRRLGGVGWWAVGVVLVALAAVLWLKLAARPPRLAPELEAFWAPHFSTRTPTLLVYGVPLFMRTGQSFYRNTRVNRAEDIDGNDETRRILDVLRPQQVRPLYHFVGVGEVEALFHLTRLLAANGAVLTVERSNVVGWEDLKGKNAILLGGRKFNPQIPEIPFKPAFEADEHYIANLKPSPGEPAEYRTVSLTPGGEVVERYALISVYPGSTPGTRLLVLECSSTDGTLAAAEFLTRPDMLAQLIARRLPLKPERGVFRAFQVVIGARFNKGVVVNLSYKTHRVLS